MADDNTRGDRLMSHTGLEELVERDLPAVQAVCEACEEYFVATTGGPAPPGAARSLLTRLPEGCSPRDKHVLGVCDTQTRELAGLIDAIVGYPDLRTLTLGLFLVMPQHVSSGVAAEACKLLEEWGRRRGASRIRIAGHGALQGASDFLSQAGFRATDDHVRDGRHRLVVLEKRLFGASIDG